MSFLTFAVVLWGYDGHIKTCVLISSVPRDPAAQQILLRYSLLLDEGLRALSKEKPESTYARLEDHAASPLILLEVRSSQPLGKRIMTAEGSHCF